MGPSAGWHCTGQDNGMTTIAIISGRGFRFVLMSRIVFTGRRHGRATPRP